MCEAVLQYGQTRNANRWGQGKKKTSPQFFNTLLKDYKMHTLINIQTHTCQRTRQPTLEGCETQQLSFFERNHNGEALRGGGDGTCLCKHPPPLPSPSSPIGHDWEMKARGSKGEGVRASSRELSIHPIQLPHLHTVWLAASNLGAFPFEGRCM